MVEFREFMEIILATQNMHKIREYREMFLR